MTNELRQIGAFRTRIFDGASRQLAVELEGKGTQWQDNQIVRVRHQDDGYSVHVGGLWVELLGTNESQLDRQIEGRCTIVKFGGAMQLRRTFRVVLEIL